MALTTVRPEGMGFNTGRRNLIINGAMRVAQRSSGPVSVADSSNEGYQTLDRFGLYYGNNAGGVVDVSQSTDVPSGYGFTNSCKIDVTTADTSVSGTHHIFFRQAVEAQDVANSGWNHTSSSSYMTLSFWAKSVKAGTYCVAIEASDSASTRIFVKEYTLVADTWKKVEITFPGESGVTVNNDNGVGLVIKWALQAGSDRNNATDNTWNSADTSIATSNQVNFYDSTDNNFFLTGVQLEVGENASDFEHRSYGEELTLCQRYAVVYSAASSGNETFIGSGTTIDSDDVLVVASLPNNLRATPTVTFTNFGVRTAASYTYNNTINGIFPPVGGNTIGFNIDSADTPYTAGQAVLCVIDAGSSNHLTLDAEL